MSKSTPARQSKGAKLPPHLSRKQAVICTADIARATTLFREIGDSTEVVLFLDGFYHLCSQHVTSAGGEVIKYMGDECLALFEGDAAVAAIDALRALREAFPGFCEERGVPPTDLKGTAHLGEVVVGTFGPEGYRDFLGKAVNNLFLMSGPGITISQQLYRKLPSDRRSPWHKRGGDVVYHLP